RQPQRWRRLQSWTQQGTALVRRATYLLSPTLAHKLTTRLGPYWLLLEASGDSTWRLQLLGDNHHEAEITAVDEEEAKDAAVVATVALLKEENPEFKEPAKVQWNPAFVSDNRFNL